MDFDFNKKEADDLEDVDGILKYLPENINFGFTEGISKQSLNDTKTLINNYAKDNFKSKRRAFFKIEKIKNHNMLPDGYFYEIHEGGYGVSFSKLLIREFEKEDSKSVLLRIKDRYVFVVRKLNDIETNYTSTNDLTEKQKEFLIDIDEQELMDKTKKPDMVSVFSDKFVFFIISQIFLISSLITIAVALFLKFSYLQVEDNLEDYKDYSSVPIMEIYNLESTEYRRIKNIGYNNSKGWYVNYEYREDSEYYEQEEIIRSISNIKSREKERSDRGQR